MNLYFQFLTQNQSKAAIDLIRLPTRMTSERPIAGLARLSSGGKLSSFGFADIETLAAELSTRQLNELEINYYMDEFSVDTTRTHVRTVDGLFLPSASGSLWCPSNRFIRADRDSGTRKMNAWKDEEMLARLGISQKPCVFEVAIKMENSGHHTEVLGNCAEWLANNLGLFSDLRVFGCCDIGGEELFVRLESNVLMLDRTRILTKVLPTSYPQLGDKFDDLHPIIFGSRQACAGLAADLGNDSRLIVGAESPHCAVVLLDPRCDGKRAKERARQWFLPTI